MAKMELRARAAGALFLACGALVGCGDDDGPATDAAVTTGDGAAPTGDTAVDAAVPTGDAAVVGNADAGQGDAGQPVANPVHIVVVRVFAENTVQYAKLSRELDFNFDSADLKGAREFPGRTRFVAHGGFVYAGDDETKFLTKFRISEDLQWQEQGKLYMGDYGASALSITPFGSNLAYSFYGDGTSRVLIDLDAMTIKGTFTDSKLPVRDGWMFRNSGSYNRGNRSAFKGVVTMCFEYSKEGEVAITQLASYDPATHLEKSVLSTTCPQVEVSSQDEQGNVYYSSVFHHGYRALHTGDNPGCVVKVKPDGTLDETWGDKPYSAFSTDPGEGFMYLGNGKAAATFTKPSAIVGLDPSKPPTLAELCQVGDPGEAYESCGKDGLPEYNGAIFYQGLIDLATNTMQPITGWEADDGGHFYRLWSVIDGRYLIGIQRPAGLAWYELNLATATVSKLAAAATGELEAEVALAARLR